MARLRQRLMPADEWLLLDGPSLGWRRGAFVTVDTAEFEAAVREGSRASLERAQQVYRGALLPDCDDDWVVPERERLRQLHESSLHRLAELLEGARTTAAPPRSWCSSCARTRCRRRSVAS